MYTLTMEPEDKHTSLTGDLRNYTEKTQLHAWEYLTASAAKPSIKSFLKRNIFAIRIAINELRRTTLLRTKHLKKHLNELSLIGHGVMSNDMARIDEMSKHAASMTSYGMLRRAKLMDKSLTAWRDAKKKNDYNVLKPHLEKLIEDVRAEGERQAEKFKYSSPYEALIDMHTPGLSLRIVERLFDEYISLYPELLEKLAKTKGIQSHEEELLSTLKHPEDLSYLRTLIHDPNLTDVDFSMSARDQKKLMRRILKDMGFDLSMVQIGVTEHSFCGGTTNDIRIGIKLNEDDFVKTIMDFVHEAGHGTYRLKLPGKWEKFAVGFIPGQGADEGLALFWEYGIGRTPAFAQYLSRIVKIELKKKVEFSANVLHRKLVNMSMSSIRAHSDELRYLLDLYVGYKIERGLIERTIEIDNVAQEWADLMEQMTGIRPQDDNAGCLQDIHLPSGYIGYKPSYLIGRLFEHALVSKLSRSNDLGPRLNSVIRSGNLHELTDWLEEHICQHGAIRSTMDLYGDITGKNPDFSFFKENFKARYLDS